MPKMGRLGDTAESKADFHNCPACPHQAKGPAVQGSPDVRVNFRPALRVGDKGVHAACCGSNTWTAAAGSATVRINYKPAHRRGDTVQHCGSIGRLTRGSDDVNVG